jgi:secondary thiamine-phosphate synthase enzyme
MVEQLQIATKGQGLYEFTSSVDALVRDSNVDNGLCTVFLRHTSASLCIQENADPSARHDLETWINRFVPENDPEYTHTAEGADDMPAHIKTVMTGCSLSIPIFRSRLGLGTWQGIYLWEHRRSAHRREILVHIGA